ncbi:MAG TPA: 16S rRNA processing protein RimM [Firmicutes bacterium]|nr:16S rRNA processing protein RimM [Bacillota bacterium]
MEYVYIGRIVNTHGIKGELRLKSDFDKKDRVFIPNMTIYIGKNYIKEEIVTYRRHKDFDMITLKGYNNINQVLDYLKMNVYVNREDLKLSRDEYLLEDLIGKKIVENEEELGKVIDIVYNGGNNLLLVEGIRNFYIPINDYYIKNVLENDNVIEVENAKGLIL